MQQPVEPPHAIRHLSAAARSRAVRARLLLVPKGFEPVGLREFVANAVWTKDLRRPQAVSAGGTPETTVAELGKADAQSASHRGRGLSSDPACRLSETLQCAVRWAAGVAPDPETPALRLY